MTEHDYTPPAEAIEREARGVSRIFDASPPSNLYSWEEAHESHRKACRAIATHVLRERHRRESPLVECLRGIAASKCPSWPNNVCTCKSCRAARVVAAHAALDRESEPTLAGDLERELSDLFPGKAETVRRVVALIGDVASARGGK